MFSNLVLAQNKYRIYVCHFLRLFVFQYFLKKLKILSSRIHLRSSLQKNFKIFGRLEVQFLQTKRLYQFTKIIYISLLTTLQLVFLGRASNELLYPVHNLLVDSLQWIPSVTPYRIRKGNPSSSMPINPCMCHQFTSHTKKVIQMTLSDGKNRRQDFFRDVRFKVS